MPASAVALDSVTTPSPRPAVTTAAAGASSLTMRIVPRRIDYNHKLTVTGRAPRADAGRLAVLQTAVSRHDAWESVASAPIGPNGGFRIRPTLRHSGLVRVIEVTRASGVIAAAALPAPAAASAVRQVAVSAQLRVAPRSLEVLGGQSIGVPGRLLPGVPGRSVRLQGRSAQGWQTLARTRTGPAGRFRVHFAAASGVQRRLRVVFSGDRTNSRSTSSAGAVTVYSPSVASWYNDAGSTACGYHAGFGVANLSLPCGTRVRIRYGGRSVTAVVDDRGPYVGGRAWDLNQNVARALGFAGVGTVWITG